MSIPSIQTRVKMQSSAPISIVEIQDAFQQTRPGTRRKRTASAFSIAEDPEDNTTPDSIALESTVIPKDTSIVQPWKSLRSRSISSSSSTISGPTIVPISTLKKPKNVVKPDSKSVRFQTTTLINTSPRKDSERLPLASERIKPDVPNVLVDRMSPFPGKENMPPGIHPVPRKRSKIDKALTTQKSASSKPAPSSKSMSANLSKSSNMDASQKVKKPSTAPKSTSEDLVQSQEEKSVSIVKTNASKEDVALKKTRHEIADEEDDQQIALVEIINLLFELFEERKTLSVSYSPYLKRHLSQTYFNLQRSPILPKIKRSIGRGALKYQHEETENGIPRLNYFSDNAAMRIQFVNLWVESYEHSILRAALESVIGKDIIIQQDDIPTSIRCFIESYLVLNEDVPKKLWTRPGITTNSRNRLAWNNTLYRSHILIMLIDQAKLRGSIHGSLFRPNSRHKSSLSILQQLNTFMRGSHSEAIRILGRSGYELTFTHTAWRDKLCMEKVRMEKELMDYDHHITNFGEDFRDGIRLARLSELVMTPVEQEDQSHDFSSFRASDLKYPADTKAAKANICKVMDALDPYIYYNHQYSDGSEIANGDVLYTSHMLWQIIDHYGIKHMIDIDDLNFEILRLDNDGVGIFVGDTVDRPPMSKHSVKCYRALRQWVVALGFKYNIEIVKIGDTYTAKPNLLTAIVKEYQQYIPTSDDQLSTGSQSLEEQLHRLGFSRKFSALLSNSRNLDSELLTPVLAFIASKVLKASKEKREEIRRNQFFSPCLIIFGQTIATIRLWWKYLDQQEDIIWFDHCSDDAELTSDEEAREDDDDEDDDDDDDDEVDSLYNQIVYHQKRATESIEEAERLLCEMADKVYGTEALP